MCETLKTNYQVLEEVGRGRFGTITRCFSPTRNEFFACKTIDKTLLADDPLDRECLIKEPKVMAVLSPHPNIVQLHDVFDSDDSLSLVVDLCDTDTLYDRLVKINGGGGFSEARASSVVRQLLVAIDHCHRFNIVHRDIKPDNVLFDSLNRVKLSDFGSADWLGEEGTLNGLVGTPYYVAPEVVLGRNYNEKVDIWSAGVVLYVMLAGIPPFYGETVEEIFEAVIRGNLRFPSKMFRTVSSEAKDLVKKMICRDVSRRISAEQALRHPWILSGGDITEMD